MGSLDNDVDCYITCIMCKGEMMVGEDDTYRIFAGHLECNNHSCFQLLNNIYIFSAFKVRTLTWKIYVQNIPQKPCESNRASPMMVNTWPAN